jgi:hypothetical protein
MIKARLAEVIRLEDRRKYENEFGELKVRMSKAEARRRLLFRKTVKIESAEELLRAYAGQATEEVFNILTQNAIREVQEQEDRVVFEMMDRAMNEANVDYVHGL